MAPVAHVDRSAGWAHADSAATKAFTAHADSASARADLVGLAGHAGHLVRAASPDLVGRVARLADRAREDGWASGAASSSEAATSSSRGAGSSAYGRGAVVGPSALVGESRTRRSATRPSWRRFASAFIAAFAGARIANRAPARAKDSWILSSSLWTVDRGAPWDLFVNAFSSWPPRPPLSRF